MGSRATDRPSDPALPEDVRADQLDRRVRGALRTLGPRNAEATGRHLAAAGQLLAEEPETAYQHARAAHRRAARVDVVREALALTAYATGRYAEALREVRAVRRLSGVDAHRALEADCERGLGRPERALEVVRESDLSALSDAERVELALVASGARADLGEHEAGLLVLEGRIVPREVTDPELRRRLALVRADRLEELGRTEEAERLRKEAGPSAENSEDEVFLFDLEDSEDSPGAAAREPGAGVPGRRTPAREPGGEGVVPGDARRPGGVDE